MESGKPLANIFLFVATNFCSVFGMSVAAGELVVKMFMGTGMVVSLTFTYIINRKTINTYFKEAFRRKK